MHRAMPINRCFIYALCSLLLLTQVTGAHLHLCLDGQEPPVQLHLPGASEHHDATEFSRPHSDREIALSSASSASGKLFKVNLPPAISGACSLDLAPAAVSIAAPLARQLPPCAAAHDLLPPARGPPQLA